MKYIALTVGKLIAKLLKLVGRRAGSFPGQVAIKFCKDLLTHFEYPSITVLVTGTNGKTSTSNLISQSFEKAGFKTVSNSRGDNIIYGISTLLMKHSDFNFKIKADVAVIEIDELTLAKYFNQIKVTDLVITNFFRDQLDRAGEMERIILKIEDAIKDYKNNLYLNEDDPNVKRFYYTCKKANTLRYSLELPELAILKSTEVKEGKFCPLCNGELSYQYYYYSHIGKYRCLNCEFKAENPDYVLKNIREEENCFEIHKEESSVKLHYNINATYHLYNLLASSAILLERGIKEDVIDLVFCHFNLGIGRMERIEIRGEKILLNLVKNPTGCNEIIKYINADKERKVLIFLLNDNDQDGRDTSWIWDAGFENINNLDTVILTGKRGYEAAVRFKLSEITKNIIIEKDVKKAVELLLENHGAKYIISTYTGLFSTREILFGLKEK